MKNRFTIENKALIRAIAKKGRITPVQQKKVDSTISFAIGLIKKMIKLRKKSTFLAKQIRSLNFPSGGTSNLIGSMSKIEPVLLHTFQHSPPKWLYDGSSFVNKFPSVFDEIDRRTIDDAADEFREMVLNTRRNRYMQVPSPRPYGLRAEWHPADEPMLEFTRSDIDYTNPKWLEIKLRNQFGEGFSVDVRMFDDTYQIQLRQRGIFDGVDCVVRGEEYRRICLDDHYFYSLVSRLLSEFTKSPDVIHVSDIHKRILYLMDHFNPKIADEVDMFKLNYSGQRDRSLYGRRSIAYIPKIRMSDPGKDLEWRVYSQVKGLRMGELDLEIQYWLKLSRFDISKQIASQMFMQYFELASRQAGPYPTEDLIHGLYILSSDMKEIRDKDPQFDTVLELQEKRVSLKKQLCSTDRMDPEYDNLLHQMREVKNALIKAYEGISLKRFS